MSDKLKFVGHWSGHWDSNPEPRADLALRPLIRRLLHQLSYTPSELVAVEGIEPTSLDYQSSALAVELHREAKTVVGLCALVFEFETVCIESIMSEDKTKVLRSKFRVPMIWLTRRGSNPHLTA